MRILHKHVFLEFLGSFLTCTGVFLFLFFIVDSFGLLDDFMRNKVPLGTIFRYYALLMPSIFAQVAPLSCLLSTIYTLGKLNHNNEIIAMRSGGLSIYEIVSPLIIFSLIICLGIFIISEKIVPESQRVSDKLREQQIEKKQYFGEKQLTNVAIYGFGNRQLFINVFDLKQMTLQGLIVLGQDNLQNVTMKLYAQNVRWDKTRWIADLCQVFTFDTAGQLEGAQTFHNSILPLQETPSDILAQSQRINYMNSQQLGEYIKKLSKSGADIAIRNLWIDLYQKMCAPFTSLIMVLVGIPCAIAVRRKAIGFSSIGISVVVGLFYYVIQAVCIALGKSGYFPPGASVLFAPLTFFIISLYIIITSP